MIDITHKSSTLRTATAQAVVKVSSQNTIEAIKKTKNNALIILCLNIAIVGN